VAPSDIKYFSSALNTVLIPTCYSIIRLENRANSSSQKLTKEITMKQLPFNILAATLLFSAFAIAQDGYSEKEKVETDRSARAEDQKKVVEDKTILQGDRKERNEAQKQVKEDRKNLKEDVKGGAAKEQIQADREKLKADREARNEEQKKVKEDRKQLNKDRKERHEDHEKVKGDRKKRRER
jgi:hypothetical protein